MKLDMISYICVEGRENAQESIDFLCNVGDTSYEIFGFNEVVVLSACKPTNQPKYTKIIPIEKLNYYEYSQVAFNKLHEYTKSEYILVFQNDGFATQPKLWNNNFLNFDYIGAPWMHSYSWSSPGREVGNGGFSLRTRKLYEETSKLTSPYGYNEDGVICVYYRDYLMSKGIVFSPLEYAYKFSIENEFDENHNIDNTFGFHGKQHVEKGKTLLLENLNVKN